MDNGCKKLDQLDLRHQLREWVVGDKAMLAWYAVVESNTLVLVCDGGTVFDYVVSRKQNVCVTIYAKRA